MPEEPSIETDVTTVSEMLNSKADFLLLDVREPDEYEIAKIDGSLLIPMNEIPQRLEDLAPHSERHIIVHCHHGGRSMRVTQFLRENGFHNAQNLAGGIDQWSLQIDPAVPRY